MGEDQEPKGENENAWPQMECRVLNQRYLRVRTTLAHIETMCGMWLDDQATGDADVQGALKVGGILLEAVIDLFKLLNLPLLVMAGRRGMQEQPPDVATDMNPETVLKAVRAIMGLDKEEGKEDK